MKAVTSLMIIAFALVGCGGDFATGTYTSETTERYREFYTNGTVYIKETEGGLKATYEVKDGHVTMVFPNGGAVRSKLDGNTIVDEDGGRYTKK